MSFMLRSARGFGGSLFVLVLIFLSGSDMNMNLRSKRAEAGDQPALCQQHALQARLEARAVRTASHRPVVTYRSKGPSLSFVSTLAVDLMESVSVAERLLADSN